MQYKKKKENQDVDRSKKSEYIFVEPDNFNEKIHLKEIFKESEEGYKFPINNSKVPINIFSEDMKILDVNKRLIQLSGYSKKELLSMKLKDIYPESAEILSKGIKKIIEAKIFPILEVNLHTKKGKIIPVEIVVTELKNYGPKSVFQGTVRDNDALMQIEKALTDIEKSFRTLAETSFDIIMLFDRECRNLYVNPTIEKLSGIPPEDFIGKKFVQLGLSDDLVKLYKETVYKVFETKTNDLIELKLPKGTWIDAFLVPEFDEKGEVKFVIITARDITERKHAEESLRESENKYRGLVNSSVDAVISVDMQMRITMWNPAAERLFGYNEKEILGKSLMTIVPKSYKKEKEEGFDEYRKTGASFVIGKTVELEGLRKDGIKIPIELSISSTRVGETEIPTAIIRNITERKMAEKAIKESEEYQRTIFSSVHTGIIVVDEKTHEILDVNQVAADLIGVSKKKIMGNICHRYICPADEGKCPISDLDQVVDNSERVLLDVKGNEIPILKTVIPIKLAGRECLLESFIDMTERKKMENALKHSEESFRALSDDSIDLIIRHDREHRHLYVNPIVEKFTGIMPEDFIGKTLYEMKFPKDLVELWEKAIDKVFKTKKNNHIEFELPKGIWIDALLVPEFDEKGDVNIVLTSARDTTERKKMETTLSREVSINNALAKLSRNLLSQASIDDISYLVLEHAKDLTQSQYGFVGYINPKTGYLMVPTLKRDFRKEFKKKDKETIFKEFKGLWGWVLNNKESILTNDPAWDPRSTGTPDDHIAINNFVSAPAMIEDKLVGQIALANADHDYTKKDLELVERLTDLYAIAINRQLLEEKIRGSEEKHRKIVEKFLETVSED
ncbi:MAG: PAS domain S-box protein [Methanobacterium sp.]|uniref:PAS domain S-box protein n=1 Tax=Methanobacterium sp. TaxID=2164 RepID=UPI003D6542FB|nr:PAS domain S-box protein [Methanobacterium sp.]